MQGEAEKLVEEFYHLDRQMKPLQKRRKELVKWFKKHAGKVQVGEARTFSSGAFVVKVKNVWKKALDKAGLVARIGQAVYDEFYEDRETIEVSVAKEKAAKVASPAAQAKASAKPKAKPRSRKAG